MELPAHTIDGLKAKARVAKNGCWHFYQADFQNAVWDHKTARSLIDAVLQLHACKHTAPVRLLSCRGLPGRT